MYLKDIHFILLSVVQLAVGQISRNRFRCDYQYVPEAGGYFKYHEIPTNWREAELRCYLEGAVLASPLDYNIKKAMFDMAFDKSDIIYTGISAKFSTRDLQSVEGVPLRKINHLWGKNEPNNFMGNQNCVAQRFDATFTQVDCDATFPYVCYKPLNESESINECGTIDNEYIKDASTGKCYKIHKIGNTWSRAYMTCVAEGASLAIVNSETEAKVLETIFEERAPSGSIFIPYDDGYDGEAMLGFQDYGEHGTWRTIEGQTLEEAGFDKFTPGEPNNSSTGEFCGSIQRAGTLNDVGCHRHFAFICEKTPSYSYQCSDVYYDL